MVFAIREKDVAMTLDPKLTSSRLAVVFYCFTGCHSSEMEELIEAADALWGFQSFGSGQASRYSRGLFNNRSRVL